MLFTYFYCLFFYPDNFCFHPINAYKKINLLLIGFVFNHISFWHAAEVLLVYVELFTLI